MKKNNGKELDFEVKLFQAADKQYLHNEREQEKVKAYQKSIDDLIYDLYGLTKKRAR
jgi:hypothetical protein